MSKDIENQSVGVFDGDLMSVDDQRNPISSFNGVL
jgi:hypothetical protein